MDQQLTFRRNIGLFLAVMIGIGAMMGPGIFALPGEVAKLAGPLGILAYLTMGLVTALTALNYSELGAAIPLAGGGYSFASRTLPRWAAFMTGWFFWIGNTLACAMYVLVFALSVKHYVWLEVDLVGLILLTTLILGFLNFRGTAQALVTITVMNLVELAVLVGFAVLGAFHIEPGYLTPFAPEGFSPFLPAMALIYISFVGFELITVASEEIIRPSKTIPRAILITVAIGTLVYVVVVGVMMGTVEREELASTHVPFIYVCQELWGRWGTWAAVIATVTASLSAFGVTLGASARILYALGRDGHLPSFLSRLHKRFRTPHYALAACSIATVVFASSGIIKFVASMADFGYLMGLAIVNYCVISLQKRMPNLRRPFKTAFFPLVPIVGILSCLLFIPALESRSYGLGLVLSAVGVGIYLIRPANRAALAKIPAALQRAQLLIRAKWRKKMRILIISGHTLGQNIAARLLSKDEYRLMFRSSEHQITFVEPDETVCKQLEDRFYVPVYQGDGTKKEILEQVGPENIDVAIAASEDDGKNVIAALQAKRLGIGQVIAIVNDPDYVPLLEENGIVAISAPWATAAMVENYLDRPGVAELFEIGTGQAGLVGVIVPPNSRVIGRKIKELQIPRECVVAAIIRKKKFVVPRGDTVVEEGDHVVFVGPAGAIKKSQELFTIRT